MEMHWSRWFHCESSFELLLVPDKPGIFAVAEEIVQPAGPCSRRMLAVFEVEEADNLARALSRLFATGSPWQEKLTQARCYVRYAMAPSSADRKSAAAALKDWLHSQRDAASQVFEQKSDPTAGENAGRFALGEMRSARRAAQAQHEGEAAQRCGALEGTELKTKAEQAVDRVTQGMKLSKEIPAGF
jgi:hypothetical protein